MKASNNYKLIHNHHFSRILIFLGFIFFLSVASSCSKDEDQKERCCPECISPDGGQVEVNDASSYLDGTKIVVPSGEVNHCAEIWIDEHEFIYFPEGFKPIEGKKGFSLGQINIPNATSMEIHLPLNEISPEPYEIICAFYTEGFWDKWHVLLPDEIHEDYMVLTTDKFHKEWSWGLIDLVEVNEEYIEPLLIETYGQTEWEVMKMRMEDFIDSITVNENDFNCMVLDAVYQGLKISRKEKEKFLIDYQNNLNTHCGYCDVTGIHFYNELIERIKLETKLNLTLLFIKQGNGIIKFVMFCVAAHKIYSIQMRIKSLDCDHVCFFNQWNAEFRENYTTYLMIFTLQTLIEFAIDYGYIDCPLPD